MLVRPAHRFSGSTALVNVASTVDFGRFSALVEDLSFSPTLLDSLAEDLSLKMPRNAVLSAPSRVEVVEWGVLPHPPSGRHEVDCMRENEATGTVIRGPCNHSPLGDLHHKFRVVGVSGRGSSCSHIVVS